MALEVQSKKSLIGNNIIMEENQLLEIQKYIKELEIKNDQLIIKNNKLENNIKTKDDELQDSYEQNNELKYKNDELEDSNEYLETELDHIAKVFPEADEYRKSYDLLTTYKQKMTSKLSFSETYHIDNSEVDKIAQYGTEVADNFVNDRATCYIPTKREDIKAELYLSPNDYEQNDGGTINQYIDYRVTVAVTNIETSEVNEYDINTFEEKYKEDVPHLEKRNESNLTIENNQVKLQQMRIAAMKPER